MEFFNNYTNQMLNSDSDRAKEKTGYSERLASAIYEVSQQLKPKFVPSIFLAALITLPLLVTTQYV